MSCTELCFREVYAVGKATPRTTTTVAVNRTQYIQVSICLCLDNFV